MYRDPLSFSSSHAQAPELPGAGEKGRARCLGRDERSSDRGSDRGAECDDTLREQQARRLYEAEKRDADRAFDGLERMLGRSVVKSIHRLVWTHAASGEYDSSEVRLLERAYSVVGLRPGGDRHDITAALDEFAALHEKKGEYGAAEELYQRALVESWKGDNRSDIATALDNLARLYRTKGSYTDAEPLLLRALSMSEKAHGPAHPDVATILDDLGLVYEAKGEYRRAEPLFLRALAIREGALGKAHPDVAAVLDDLARLYQVRGEYGRAQPLLERALAIQNKAHDQPRADLATPLHDMALLYQARGDYGHAEPLFLRALAIREGDLGEGHPYVATVLTNLAELYRAQGDYERAEPLLQRALGIQEKALGAHHPEAATVLTKLAVVYWASGRIPEAVDAEARGLAVREEMLGHLLATGSESQKLAFLGPFVDDLYRGVSFALDTRQARTAYLALLTLLRRKGRALDAMAGSMRALRARVGRDERKLFDELMTARARYATLSLRGPGTTPLDAYRRECDSLNERIQELEDAISLRSDELGADEQLVNVERVRAALPDHAALVEWTAYQPFNPRARFAGERLGAFRYAACVLPKRSAPACIDLGDVRTVDADVQTFLAALRRPGSTDVAALARALDARVMAPVRALLGGAHRVFLSPDGALNLVPFAALIGEDGRPLIEQYAFTYLTSGRDLLRHAAQVPAQQGPLILAAPDFDDGAATPGAGRFSPLLHADEEALAASRVLPGARVLEHDQATKAALQNAHGPRLLHIGTHGYFEPIACSAGADRAALANPLLRSGIALAGANACADGHDEGLLTAFEAANLDLYGTQLAVLSACQTGVGAAQAGDGVYGLRRALVLAGAETQVMTLWPVDGAPTAAVMKAYYERLASGEGRSDAMRHVQLAFLHTSGREHPYYWAPFIVSGNDEPLALDDKPAKVDLRVHPGGACACRLGEDRPEGGAAWLAVLGLLAWTARRARGARGA
jgi:CHAT domain-containing protein/tetratricopeptide (TPR) repeat protein